MSEVRALAQGKWAGILGRHLTEAALSGRHGPCPLCKSGKDKFRFDDLDGNGTWICGSCGAGDGFHFLQHINGWTFPEAAKHVEQNAGKVTARPVKPGRSDDDIKAALQKVWNGAKRVETSDPAGMYLAARGVAPAAFPACLRFHPCLPYVDDDGVVTKHPAMLAQVVGSDGKALTIHRTWLTDDGKKTEVATPRKLMTPLRKLDNVAIRLAPVADGWLGVAEGIETSLAASLRHKVPVWACVTAGLLKSFRPPPEVKLLAIFGDNDRSFTGQAAAFELARAVTNTGVECRVMIPEITGTDWADDSKETA